MANIYWGGGNGDWATSTNWTGGVVPGSTDTAIFNGSSTFTATINSNETIGSVIINDANAAVADNATLTLGTMGTLTVTSGLFLLDAGGGIVNRGTINNPGNLMRFDGGKLNGVTFDGTMVFGVTKSSVTITSAGVILHNASGTGAGAMAFNSTYCTASFQGTQTLDSATVTLRGAGDYLDQVSAAGTLTLGANLTINDIATAGYQGIRGGTATGYALVNEGAIDVSAGGASFYLYSGSFTNQGSIDVSAGTMHLEAATWVNTGHITVAAGGTLALGGSGTLGSLTNAGVVAVTGALNNTGGTLNVGAGAAQGTMTLAGGTITGGLIANDGSGLVMNSGELLSLTSEGTVTVAGAAASVTLAQVTFEGAGGTGAGVVDVTGVGANVWLPRGQVLRNVALDLAAAGAYVRQIYPSGSLTIFSTSMFEDTATSGAEGVRCGTLINQGVIDAASGSGLSSFYLDSQTITNSANLEATGAASSLTIGGQTLTNTGTIAATASGAVVDVDAAAWSNTGQITASGGGTVDLGGTIATSALGSLSSAGGGVIALSGSLTNTGATLSVGGPGPVARFALAGGTISGGTIAAGSNVTLNGGVLDGVIFQGAMNLSSLNASVTISNIGIVLEGAGGTGAAAINLSAVGANLWVQGNQTLSSATITLSANGAYVGQIGYGTASPELTLGADLTVIDTATHGRQGIQVLNALYNNGSIDIVGPGTSPGPSFSLAGETVVNHGGIVAGYGTLDAFVTSIANYGSIEAMGATGAAYGGTVSLFGGIYGSGTLEIGARGTLITNSSVDSAQTVIFAGTGAILGLGNSSAFEATIGGLADTDTIDFKDVVYAAGMSASVDTHHHLNLYNNSGTIVATVTLAGNYMGATFTVTADSPISPSGTDVTMGPTGPHTLAANASRAGAFIDAMAALGGAGAHEPGTSRFDFMGARPVQLATPSSDGLQRLHALA